MIVPVVAEGGGEAAQARKKRREAVAVFTERASVEAVGASSRAFAGGEVKRTRRDRSALDAHRGRGSARTADAEFVGGGGGRPGEGGFAFEPVDAAPPLVASDRGQVPRDGLSGLRGCLFPAPYGHPGPEPGVTFYCRSAQNLLVTVFLCDYGHCRCREFKVFLITLIVCSILRNYAVEGWRCHRFVHLCAAV